MQKIMKKRWLLLIGLALALATQLALPAIAYAAPQQKFTGEGTLTITYMPDPVPLGPKLLLFKDEIVVGTIQTCDGLPALVGAELYSVHTTLARVDWSTMDMKGVLKGTFTLTATNGDVMKGAMVATQEGNLLGDIVSKGTWVATQRKGIFKDVVPAGKWQSTISLDGSGPLTWEGKLLERGRNSDKHDSDD